jgi:hypothetical protein
MDERQQNEAAEDPYWGQEKHSSSENLTKGPPDEIQNNKDDEADVGHGGDEMAGRQDWCCRW